MTVFLCAACAAPLTEDLVRLEYVPARPGYDGHKQADGERRAPSTVERGRYAVDPDPSGAPFVPAPTEECVEAYPGGPCKSDPDGPGFLISAGPRNTILLHPDDAVALVPHPEDERRTGCCGPTGDDGVNWICPCGNEVATLMADCWTPYELHLVPDRVRPTEA